ncbi:hypothetical protein B0T26DRAFT_755171 [Lasiosphaeria miniovina]|uniref:DUF676 domain-containing protein n=1 Tax=Lasiosphaeria miniovina TaxID=1954250 RepID=A0AA40A652_9PEZI|nr:uncharacterized protein B0T26DRAFT_755171 [Lasiosphaeria miniovina]KAK0710048.1 hypothetical protein B0T26DRAFT_755171 [Lasiosphaeria miniovina]
MPQTLTEVAAGTGKDGNGTPAIDIVAVHGLNPKAKSNHAWRTWTTNSDRLWLRDDLPEAFPDARALIYQYDSVPVLMSTKTRLVQQATDLLYCIDMERDTCPTRPLIFVAHSLGGILALVNAANNPEYTAIKQSTRGLAFFGTPHAGGNETLVSFGSKCAVVVNFVNHSSANDLVGAVKRGSQYADTLAESWKHQLTDYRIVSFYEGIGNIVPRDSAVLGMPGLVETVARIDADHSNICRFDTSVPEDMNNYKKVQHGLGKICQAALRLPPFTPAAQASNTQTNNVARDDIMVASMDLRHRSTNGSETEEQIPKLLNAMSVLRLVARHSTGDDAMPRPDQQLFD